MRDAGTSISDNVLHWYDQHARDLPWRVSPADRASGVAPDPYKVWMSEIMLQQTTVAAVASYFHRFTSLWPNVSALAGAEDADVMAQWAGLGYYARARNLLKCARMVVDEHGGVFPDTYDALIKLPGIGPYTAGAISAIAFDRAEPVMDGNVERVMARVFNEHDPLPSVKPALKEHVVRLTPQRRPGDYAQAIMDLGATICTPKSPACGICPLMACCLARQHGTAAELPKKTPKANKPTRYGFVYLGRRTDGAWLLETRPKKGLLGGMLGWPGSDWSADPAPKPPCDADWREVPGEVRHTFTHFHLILKVFVAELPQETHEGAATFINNRDFNPDHLPTVMAKAYKLVRGSNAA